MSDSDLGFTQEKKQVPIQSDSSQTRADIHITLNFSPVCGYLQLSQLRKWKVIQIFILLHAFEIYFIKKSIVT